MSQPGLVSVIVPAYNVEPFIGQAVESVLRQTYREFEILVVDDGSTDGTAGELRKFRDPRLRVLMHTENKGICEARNTGLRAARGIWVAPLDGDDAWDVGRLTRLTDEACRHPRAFIGSNVLFCFSGPRNEMVPWKTLFEDRGWDPGPVTRLSARDLVRYGLDVKPLFPLEIVRSGGLSFSQEYWGHEWLVFLLQLIGLGLEFVLVDDPSYHYRLRPRSDSVSHSTIRNQLKASTFLAGLPWLDNETLSLLHGQTRATRHRLLTTALLERRWGTAVRQAVCDPGSVGYLLTRVRPWLRRKRAASDLAGGKTRHR